MCAGPKSRKDRRELVTLENNEFASAISVISIAAARSANNEAKVALAAVQNRLHNYALVHHALQMPEHTSYIDAAAYLRQLCRAISRSKLESKGIIRDGNWAADWTPAEAVAG
jgi:two-component sensor histidine kinase